MNQGLSQLFAIAGPAIAICYLAVPIYAAAWIRAQKRAAANTTLGIIYICVWSATFIAGLMSLIGGSFYRENTSSAENILGGVILVSVFLLLPAACFFHLRSASVKRHEA